jgi:hypothetical protein
MKLSLGMSLSLSLGLGLGLKLLVTFKYILGSETVVNTFLTNAKAEREPEYLTPKM